MLLRCVWGVDMYIMQKIINSINYRVSIQMNRMKYMFNIGNIRKNNPHILTNRVMTIDENLCYYNCLNISSASNKFYPELLRWSKNIVVNYSKLIPNDFENKRYFVQRYAMKLYRMVNELYVINGRELEEKTIVDLLRQAYEEFREYLFDFSLERNDGDPSVEESVVEYKEFIGKCDFEGLYFYLIKKTEKNESTVKTTIRNLCRNIKTLSLKIKSFMLYVK